MKICFISPSWYPATMYGGAIFSSKATCEGLAKLGHEVYVSTTDVNGNSRLELDKNKFLSQDSGIFVKYYKETILNYFSSSMFFNLAKDMKKADIVHVQATFSFSTLLALYLNNYLWREKKLVLSPRGALGSECLGMKRSILKKIWLEIMKMYKDRICWHATCEKEKKEVLDIFEGAMVEIVPNGVNLEEYSLNKLSKNSKWFSKYFKEEVVGPVLISMGRVNKIKGFDILIKSFNLVLEKYPKAKLVIAGGDGGELKILKNLVQTLALEKKVCFCGEILGDEKKKFYVNADLFVLPSHNENFGNVYVESLASGTPIVASLNTPWREVQQNKCGLWVKNDVNSTAKAILNLLKEDLVRMGENGKTYVSNNFEWNIIVKKFEKLYESLEKKR